MRDKLTDEERSEVEHARQFAASATTAEVACFAETYRKLVSVIDRLAPKSRRT